MLLFLTIGTLLMAGVMLLCNLWIGENKLKVLAVSVLFTVSGFLGAKLMYFIESGSFEGVSYFGALFFAPLMMICFALLLKMKPGTVLDLCAPAECIMLALLKVRCFIKGCCRGVVLSCDAEGNLIRFPSQLTECAFAILTCVLFCVLARKKRWHDRLYPIYMIVYGVERFVLNLFRETEPFVLGMAAGNFWSLVSVFLGLSVLYFTVEKQRSESRRHEWKKKKHLE